MKPYKLNERNKKRENKETNFLFFNKDDNAQREKMIDSSADRLYIYTVRF